MPSHTECVGYNCHFDRPKYHFDPFPSFKFPTKPHEHTTTEGITETISTLVTDTLKPSATVKSITSEDTTNAVSETFTDIIKATTDTIDKTAATFNEGLTDIIEITSEKIAEVTKSLDESITHAIHTTSATIGETTKMLDETLTDIFDASTNIGRNSNADDGIAQAVTDNSEIVTAASNVGETTTDSIFSQIYTSTEEIIKSITGEQGGDKKFENDNDNAGIYVILGIILALLIIIIAIIVIMYIRHRKNKSHTLTHPYYDVCEKKDSTSVSIENEGTKDRVYVNDVYVQYSC